LGRSETSSCRVLPSHAKIAQTTLKVSGAILNIEKKTKLAVLLTVQEADDLSLRLIIAEVKRYCAAIPNF
jgi:hypothetical protein